MTAPQASVGRLVVCPTPIGNLEDVTLRVLATLAAADLVACEDTRHTRVLLDHHGLTTRLVSLHEHNERARARELVDRIVSGGVVALVSDAGTPLVSDPGYELVRECLAAHLTVEVLPGASAVTTALLASGLPSERWRFVGFLPRSRGERSRLLTGAAETTVAFESPRRLARTLAELAEHDPQRSVAVCRELTKLHEEVVRGEAGELARRYDGASVRGEVTLVIGAASARQTARMRMADAVAATAQLVDAGAKPRPAAAVVAQLTDLAANDLYREMTR